VGNVQEALAKDFEQTTACATTWLFIASVQLLALIIHTVAMAEKGPL
jgi:hypothetical protein